MEAVIEMSPKIFKGLVLLAGNLHFAAPPINQLVKDCFVLLKKLIVHQYLFFPDGAVMKQFYFLVYIGEELAVVLLPEINNAAFSLTCVCEYARLRAVTHSKSVLLFFPLLYFLYFLPTLMEFLPTLMEFLST